ncbi:MAG: hypothetical protein L6R38_005266 [Xanthoria sp. 2 TBL-2021]|nr:MAG: hypothetical protein L6R38_005266 [Xanthoria sp. 2 TBL-2021]
MAERCPKTLLGVAVSGLSSLALFYYGASIDQDLLSHIDTLLAATPTPIIPFEEILPSAVPTAVQSYIPGFLEESLSFDLLWGHDWSTYLLFVVIIWVVYDKLRQRRRKQMQLSSYSYLLICVQVIASRDRWIATLEKGVIDEARVYRDQGEALKENVQVKKEDDGLISDLRRELSDSKDKGKKDADEISDLKAGLRDFELKERQDKMSMLQKEITMATTVMHLEYQLEAMTVRRDQSGGYQFSGDQIGEMIDIISELQVDNAQLEAKASGLEHRVTTLEADNVSMRQSTKMARDTIERHESTIDELRKKDGQQKCTLQCLNETIRTLEIEKTATATAAEKASSKNQSLQAREDNLKVQHGRAIDSLRANSNAHISSLEDQVAGNERTMAEQKRTLAEYQGDLKRRNLTIGDLQDRISVLQGQLTTAKASSAAVEKDFKTTTSAYDELSKRHGISEGMVAKLSAKIEDFEAALRNAGSGPGCPTQSSPAVVEPAANGTGPDEVGEEPTVSSSIFQQIVLHGLWHLSYLLTWQINQPHKPKRNTARSRRHCQKKRQEAKALAEAAASRSSDTQLSDNTSTNTNESRGNDQDQKAHAKEDAAQAADEW